MKDPVIKLLLLSIITIFLVGCWDYVELENLGFVMSIGVDAVEPEYEVIIEILKPSGGSEQTQFTPETVSTRNQTFFAAGRSLINPVGKQLFWSHGRILIISEEVARQDIFLAIEHVLRDVATRTSLQVYIAKDCTTEEIFSCRPRFANSIGEHIVALSDLHKRIPTFIPQELWQFRKDQARSGISSILPTVRLVHEGEEPTPVLDGLAVFKGDKMVGWLNGSEARYIGLLKNRTDRGFLVINSTVLDQRTHITYEVGSNNVKIRPVVEGEKISMAIDLRMELDLTEAGLLKVDFLDPEVIRSLEGEFNQSATKVIEDILYKLQREFKTDTLGFGQALKRKHPKLWRKYEPHWDEIYPNLDVAVKVQGTITFTGLLQSAPQMEGN